MSVISEFVRRHFRDVRGQSFTRGLPVKATEQPELKFDRRWTLFDYFAVVVLIAFSALRFEVGTDYLMYANRFAALNPGSWSEQLAVSPQEIGYTILSLALRSVTESPNLIFWVMSVLTVLPVYVTIKKQSLDPTMSLLLYVLLAFFVSPFNIMRQGVAISLSFWASTFLNKNKLAFVAMNALAATFHSSALIVAAIQFLVRNAKPTKGKAVLIGVLAVAAAAGFHQLPFLTALLNNLNDRYEAYLGATAAGIGTYLVIASRAALLAFAMKIGQSELARQYGMYVLVGIAFLIIGTQSIAVNRMELYFGIFLILLIPNQLHGHKNAFTYKVLLYAFGGLYFAQYLSNWGNLIPYKTYLFN